MPGLSLAVAMKLAASCAPAVAPETWLSLVHTESRLNTLSVGDNTTHQSYDPSTLDAAVSLATRLVAAGHSVDLGVAQLNTTAGHLQRRGLSIAAAFDPCVGFRVGGEVLAECYRRTSGADEQARLRQATGCYNTGSIDRGASYTARVWQSAALIIPAIRLIGSAQQAPTDSDARTPAPPPAPPGLEDGLHPGHAASDAEDGMADALHHPAPKDPK